MAVADSVVPVDEFVTDEWYPGFRPAYGHAPFVVEPFGTFSKEDESRFWFLDFHWSRGLTPLGLLWNEDGYGWGTQFAAELMPLPTGRGVAQRIAGTHTYAASIPVNSPQEVQRRMDRMRRYLPGFLHDFESTWARHVAELDEGFQYFRGIDFRSVPLERLAPLLREARAYHRRAFEIHFAMMYPLLANFRGFCGVCSELGIDSDEIGKFLQGYDTKIAETDRELWRLTRAALSAGLETVFAAHDPERLNAELIAAGGAASGWLAQLTDFLDVYGFRTEGTADVALPSWREDPTPVLGTIKTFLAGEHDFDFDAAAKALHDEREDAIDRARSQLTLREQRIFDAALASVRAANFRWWQDDHNFHIDLRAALPLRWAALAVAERAGAQRPDDTLFLFWPELMAVATRQGSIAGFASIIEARRQYFEYWHERRGSMPRVLGTIPEFVDDPIMVEIFGLTRDYLAVTRAARSGAVVHRVTGIGAAKGTARGTARVLRDADELYRVLPGEVLVCESISPNWTPAFARIAACVCDGGGMMSHAAIVGREYGVPTVTACALATAVIADGDVLEVDGDRGVVTVLRSAS